MNDLHGRFWLDAGLAATSAVVLLATLLWRGWIEMLFRVDPDQGSGSLEWSIVAVTAVAAITCTTLARHEWRRVHQAGG